MVRCRNCRYYVAYYRVMEDTFVGLNYGLCKVLDKQVRSMHFCNGYKERGALETRQTNSINSRLKAASIALCEIAFILKEKEENEKST